MISSYVSSAFVFQVVQALLSLVSISIFTSIYPSQSDFFLLSELAIAASNSLSNKVVYQLLSRVPFSWALIRIVLQSLLFISFLIIIYFFSIIYSRHLAIDLFNCSSIARVVLTVAVSVSLILLENSHGLITAAALQYSYSIAQRLSLILFAVLRSPPASLNIAMSILSVSYLLYIVCLRVLPEAFKRNDSKQIIHYKTLMNSLFVSLSSFALLNVDTFFAPFFLLESTSLEIYAFTRIYCSRLTILGGIFSPIFYQTIFKQLSKPRYGSLAEPLRLLARLSFVLSIILFVISPAYFSVSSQQLDLLLLCIFLLSMHLSSIVAPLYIVISNDMPTLVSISSVAILLSYLALNVVSRSASTEFCAYFLGSTYFAYCAMVLFVSSLYRRRHEASYGEFETLFNSTIRHAAKTFPICIFVLMSIPFLAKNNA